jgi:hypothetical protein
MIAADAGCDVFIPKPRHPERLLHHVTLRAHRHRQLSYPDPA